MSHTCNKEEETQGLGKNGKKEAARRQMQRRHTPLTHMDGTLQCICNEGGAQKSSVGGCSLFFWIVCSLSSVLFCADSLMRRGLCRDASPALSSSRASLHTHTLHSSHNSQCEGEKTTKIRYKKDEIKNINKREIKNKKENFILLFDRHCKDFCGKR